ncbi:uncharacterized protein [Diadema antillarum]|uniref:uncharacterized protein n=1 Tax=Diadema antillarum TaxID=105358 RepID=UPI003A8C08A8
MESSIKYTCELCSAKFSARRNLRRHHRIHHQDQQVLHACKVCGQTFKRIDSLKRHEKSRHHHQNIQGQEDKTTAGARKYICLTCNAEFSVRRNLTRHHRTFHQDQRVLYVCNTCGKAFGRPDSLRRHEKTQHLSKCHSDEESQRLVCSECNAHFTTIRDLEDHKKTHYPKETYLCHTCGRVYNECKKFVKHIKSHGKQSSLTPTCKRKSPRENQSTRRKKPRCPQSDQQSDLSTDIKLPPHVDPEGCVARMYKEHWYNIKDRQSQGRVHRWYNFHLQSLDNTILKEKARKVFELQSTAFKINASYGFVLFNNETEECRYYYASRNTKIFNEPYVITNHASFEGFINTFIHEDVLEYARSLRPNSKWVVQHITNVTFYVFSLIDHPIGRGMELPLYVLDNKAIVSLVKNRMTGKTYDDNLCLFRCIALLRGCSSKCLETTTKELLKSYKPNEEINKFPGVKLSELSDVEEFFQINIIVYQLVPVGDESIGGDCGKEVNDVCTPTVSSTETEKDLFSSEQTVAATLIRRGLDKFAETLYVNLHDSHFSYIIDIESLTREKKMIQMPSLYKVGQLQARNNFPVCDESSLESLAKTRDERWFIVYAVKD